MSIDAERPVRQAVGREGELSRLSAFLAGAGTARALVLVGEAGSGKTTLWEEAIARGRGRGLRVFAARPTGSETALSFAALTDLLEDVDLAALPDLPEPQRHSLEVALLRVEPAARGPEPRALATGLLNALRALAVAEPVVVAVDDVPSLDRSSADALAFAARRVGDQEGTVPVDGDITVTTANTDVDLTCSAPAGNSDDVFADVASGPVRDAGRIDHAVQLTRDSAARDAGDPGG